VIDSSVLVAGLIESHEFNELAQPLVDSATESRLPGMVIAETWAVLRRAPWNFAAAAVQSVLEPWLDEEHVVATPASAYVAAIVDGRRLNIGGNINDFLIAYTCASAGLPLTTLDRRQAAIAREIPGLAVTLLLPGRAGNGSTG
jgi:predicted nucleic acid-binding protein